jgi:DNA helicase IV
VVIDGDAIEADLRHDRLLQRTLDRLWPKQSAAAVVRSLFGRPAALDSAAEGILSRDERVLLRRRPASSVAQEPWSDADLPLLDEAQARLSEPPRRYGHVVVDEAQDLSAMALRMIARRSADGRSFTILGDLAQATAPGACHDWANAIDALGDPPGARIESLSIGYRVPRQIMDLANRMLLEATAGTGTSLPVTTSVRATDDEAVFRWAAPAQLAAAVVDEAAGLLARFPSTAVVAVPAQIERVWGALLAGRVPTTTPGQPPAAGQVSLLDPAQAKGLEFDAVVVVEPGAFLARPGGTGLLYIALTRAVQHLSVVHADDLPRSLTPAAAWAPAC